MKIPQRRRERRGTAQELNGLTEQIIGSAIAVHGELEPGLLESACETCLAFELARRGLGVKRQLACPVRYREILIDAGFRVDLLVAGDVVVELKVVESLRSIHEAQLLTYLKLTGCCVGLLINFHTQTIRDGIRRIVRDLPEC